MEGLYVACLILEIPSSVETSESLRKHKVACVLDVWTAFMRFSNAKADGKARGDRGHSGRPEVCRHLRKAERRRVFLHSGGVMVRTAGTARGRPQSLRRSTDTNGESKLRQDLRPNRLKEHDDSYTRHWHTQPHTHMHKCWIYAHNQTINRTLNHYYIYFLPIVHLHHLYLLTNSTIILFASHHFYRSLLCLAIYPSCGLLTDVAFIYIKTNILLINQSVNKPTHPHIHTHIYLFDVTAR